MSEKLSSSSFLKKYYNINNIDELVNLVGNLPEERIAVLEIKHEKYDRSVTYNKADTTLKALISQNTPADNIKLLILLLPLMLKKLDDDADDLAEGRKMKAPGSILAGNWIDGTYSTLLNQDKSRRNSLRHILDQLFL